MSGGGIEAVPPILPASLEKGEELFLRGRFGRLWIAAHLVQRQQRMVNIQRSVLYSLGDNRTGQLLPPHDEG